MDHGEGVDGGEAGVAVGEELAEVGPGFEVDVGHVAGDGGFVEGAGGAFAAAFEALAEGAGADGGAGGGADDFVEGVEFGAGAEGLAVGAEDGARAGGAVDYDHGDVAEHDLVDGPVGLGPFSVLLGGVHADLVQVADYGEAGGAKEAWETGLLALKFAEEEVEEGGEDEYVGEEGDRVGGREAQGLVNHLCNICWYNRGSDKIEDEERE